MRVQRGICMWGHSTNSSPIERVEQLERRTLPAEAAAPLPEAAAAAATAVQPAS
jgi:hypothetical protein